MMSCKLRTNKNIIKSVWNLVRKPYKKYTSLIYLISLSPVGWAAEGDVSNIGSALQGLINLLTGKTAKLLAILAITALGYATLSGKLSLKHAVYICLGIGIIFGAPTIVSMLGVS